MNFIEIIDFIFSIGLLINGLLFVPQIIKLIKTKDSTSISLVTFFGFCFIQIAAISYGILHNDKILISGYMFSLIFCITTVFLAIYYKKK